MCFFCAHGNSHGHANAYSHGHAHDYVHGHVYYWQTCLQGSSYLGVDLLHTIPSPLGPPLLLIFAFLFSRLFHRQLVEAMWDPERWQLVLLLVGVTLPSATTSQCQPWQLGSAGEVDMFNMICWPYFQSLLFDDNKNKTITYGGVAPPTLLLTIVRKSSN